MAETTLNNTGEIDFEGIVDAAVGSYMKATNTPGMAAALVYQDNQPFFNYGFIDTEQSAAVTETTIFGIGSVTKVFTSILLQSAVDNNAMSLSDRVIDYLPPEVGENGTDILSVTLQDLATHTAGMPNQGGGQPAFNLFGDEPPSAELIKWWENFRAAPAVGNCWRYSNIGFVTLGYAVAGCNPNQYNQLLAEVITTPLEMPHTASSVVPGVPVAQGYIGNATTTTKADGMPADLKSNAIDMQSFIAACIFPNQTSPIGAAISGTQKPLFAGDNCQGCTPLKFRMGLAWQISEMTAGDNSYQLSAKDGATGLGGYEAWVGVVPELTGIVLLSNKFMQSSQPSTPTIGSVGRSILQNILNAANG